MTTTEIATTFHRSHTTETMAVNVRTAQDLDAHLRRNFGVGLVRDEGEQETREITEDRDLAASVERALEQARRGEGRPWREVFAELD